MFPKIIEEKIDWYIWKGKTKEINGEYDETYWFKNKKLYSAKWRFNWRDINAYDDYNGIFNINDLYEDVYEYGKHFLKNKKTCELPDRYFYSIGRKKIDYFYVKTE